MYPVTQDFIDKMKADRRQVLARVAIDYTDPFLDQSLEIEANEQANISYPQQTADSVQETTHKWASLDGSWVLDGTYHLAPPPDKLSQYQFGWWGLQLAGAGGAFAAPYPALTVAHLPRPIHTLRVVGDTAREEYPVDFAVELYAPDDTLLYAETVTGNTEINWSKTLASPVLDVVKQVLTITRWSHAGRCAKIVEFFTSIREVYETGDLISIRLLEEREASQGSLPVGNISSNEITLTLNNVSKKFDLDNEQSPLHNLLKPNRRIQAWLGAEAENLDSENPPTFTRNSVAYLSDGTQVAANQPRFEDGKFGKGVLIEEGTTNLLTANMSSVETDLTGFAANLVTLSRDSTHSLFGDYSLKCVWNNTPGDAFIVVGTFTLQPSTTYTWSYYVYSETSIYIYGNNQFIQESAPPWRGIGLASIILLPAGKWVKISGTGTTHSDWLGSSRLILRPPIVDASASAYSTVPIWIDGIQVEQKPYATSFVIGTRDNEVLKVPANVLNKGNWTIDLKYKAHQGIDDTRFRVLWECFIDYDNWYQVSFAPSTSAGKLLLRVSCDGNVVVVESDVILSAGTTYDITATGDGENLKLYVDGAQVGLTTPYAEPVGNLPDYMYIGGQPAHYANGIIDDLRISNRARTDEEILEAYQSNKPLSVDEWTTYKLSFDGHLYRSIQGTAWIPLGTFWSLDWDSPDDSLEATVTARDRMELLRKSTFQTSQVLQNKSLYELAEIVLQDAGLTSDQYIIDTALQNIIVPYAWFNPVSHREALRKIAEAGLAAAFQNRDGKIQIESFLLSGDEPVLEITEDDYFPPLRAPSRQDQVANEIIVDTQPLRPASTAEEVYRSNEPITIPGNTTKTITAFYNQPPVIDAVASLDSPPAGVSITEATYYGWGASIKIQNTNATDQQVTLIIQGKPLTVQNKERAIARDEAGITENGVLTFEFPANPLVQTLAQAQAIANTLLASVKDPRRDIEVEWRGNPALELGDRVTVKGKDYHIIRQEIDWAGVLSARLTGRKT